MYAIPERARHILARKEVELFSAPEQRDEVARPKGGPAALYLENWPRFKTILKGSWRAVSLDAAHFLAQPASFAQAS